MLAGVKGRRASSLRPEAAPKFFDRTLMAVAVQRVLSWLERRPHSPISMLANHGLAVGIFPGVGASIPELAIYLCVGLVAWAFSSIVSGANT